jgi:hypothetical protein
VPDESTSPSTGWRGVYATLGATTDVESDPPERECPDCGVPSGRVSRGLYRCPEHGAWRAGALG